MNKKKGVQPFTIERHESTLCVMKFCNLHWLATHTDNECSLCAFKKESDNTLGTVVIKRHSVNLLNPFPQLQI